jgi:chemotaxis response regulator CheB
MSDAPAAYPIVGIGGSAGGVEALEHFFSRTAADARNSPQAWA